MAEPTAEIIDSLSRIDLLLKELSKSRVGISIRLPNDSQLYTSIILEVDSNARTFALDELIPADGNAKLKVAGRFQAEGLIRKVSARFSAKVVQIVDAEGLPYYSAAIPECIEYRQQRRNYRVYINLSNPMNILMSSDTAGEISGRVVNLSLGGAGFITRQDIAAEPGDTFPRCALALPCGMTLDCQACIRYYHFNAQSGDWRGGLEFIGLQADQEKALRACIMDIERRALRVRPEG